jgi:intein-encoded DNA endonuclease-like protein
LTVSNTNLEALKYVKTLLNQRSSIECTGPHLGSRGGVPVVVKGKLWRANKDCYNLRIRSNSIAAFCGSVGFSIARKNRVIRATSGD